MAGDIEFTFSYEKLGELLNSPEMVAEMDRRIKAAEAWAVAHAPVAKTGKHRGRYKASFRSSAFPHGGASHDRAEGELVNDAPEALYVEYGNRGAEPYHLMLRALVEGARD